MGHAPLQIDLLGPFRVRASDGAPLGWSAKTRALLVVLVAASRPVERGALCGLLWPDVPEDRARLSLRVALTRLRSVLCDRIRADRRTVTFEARPGDDIDLLAVRAALAGAAAGAAAGGDVSSGNRSSPAADVPRVLDRVRGPLGEGLEDGMPQPFLEWLAGARAETDAVLGALAAGATGGASGGSRDGRREAASTHPLDVLRGALDRDPLQERVVRDVMLACARAGSYDDAESVYGRFAATLLERTGLAPAAATVHLRDRIRAARARRARHNLPDAGHGLCPGDDLARLVGWLDDPERRLVCIFGPAGTGKSALAIAAARAVVHRFLDGVLFVAPAAGPRMPLPERIAAAGSRLDGAEREPAGRTSKHGATRARTPEWTDHERLVVLGGLDPAQDDIVALVELLEVAPRLRFLVTATAPLGLVFEHRFPVGRP